MRYEDSTSPMQSQIPLFRLNGVRADLAEADRSHTNYGFTSVSKVDVREVDIFTQHSHMTMDGLFHQK